jgi:aldehyde dehydrogenase (NAD+)
MKVDVEQLIQDFSGYSLTEWPLKNRINRLKLFAKVLADHQRKVLDALERDLLMSEGEGLISEVLPVLEELDQLVFTPAWLKDRYQLTKHGYSCDSWQPYGMVTIISERYHPVLLPLLTMVDAIAAGNRCIIIWPTSLWTIGSCLKGLIERVFDYQQVQVFCMDDVRQRAFLKHMTGELYFYGHYQQVAQLLSHHQFGVALHWLSPGKNPAIVTRNANIKLVAEQLLLGKLYHEGQSIFGIDYVLVDSKVVKDLTEELIKVNERLVKKRGRFGGQKLPSVRQLQWLESLLNQSTVILGGTTDPISNKMEFTVIIPDYSDHPSLKFPIMGPVLPMVVYNDEQEVNAWMTKQLSALVTYWYGKGKPKLPKDTGLMIVNRGYWLPHQRIRVNSVKGYTYLGGKSGVMMFGHWTRVHHSWLSFSRQQYEGRLISNSYHQVKQKIKEKENDLR